MKNSVGIIGIGQMGSVMAKGFAKSGIVEQKDIYVYNRTAEKVGALKDEFPQINACESTIEVAKNSRYLIISIPPPAIPEMVEEVKEHILPSANLLLSSSNVRHKDIKGIYDGKITTFLPTVNSDILRGIIFACHNNKVADDEKVFFDKIMGAICTKVRVVKEDDFPALDNLSGCMPAFLSTYICTFANKAVELTKNPDFDYSKEELKFFAQESFIALAMLLEEQQIDIEDIIKRVGHPGGITYAGLEALDAALPKGIDDLFERTNKRHHDTRDKVKGVIDGILESEA